MPSIIGVLYLIIFVFLGMNIANASDVPKKMRFQQIVLNKDIVVGEVISLLQDNEGFMWFGGENSLIRYDGYELKQMDMYIGEGENAEKIPIQVISALYQDAKGIIWIAAKQGLLKLDPTTNQVSTIKQADGQSIQFVPGTKSKIFNLDINIYTLPYILVNISLRPKISLEAKIGP